MARRRRKSKSLVVGTVVLAAGLHVGALAAYEATREVPEPLIMVEMAGEGTGVVTSLPIGLHCGANCQTRFPRGQVVSLTATVGENSTFEGWSDGCGPQAWRAFRWGAEHFGADADPLLTDEVHRASARPLPYDPLSCELRVEDKLTKLGGKFGLIPEEQELVWVKEPEVPTKREKKLASVAPPLTVALPDADFEPENIIEPVLPDEMEIEEPEPLVPEPPVVPEPPPPKVPEQPAPQPAEQPKMVQAPKMKSVEVPDENEVEAAPDDATHLSDKNRDVAEETHAKQTNLERANEGKQNFSEESDIKSEDIGAKEDEIAELEDTDPSDLDSKDEAETAHNGKDKKAEGVIRGDEGEDGDEGESGNDKPNKNAGVLSMRGIDGRGAPGGPIVSNRKVEEGTGASGQRGDGGARGRRGKRGRRGIKTELEYTDYSRIVGKEKVEEEVRLAKRKISRRRGRWEKKLGAIQSSLENFTPEVRPGNQTALKTRAAPFAVYIARMHRKIHKLWGFGFLDDLDDKSSSHPLNNWKLESEIEIVVNPDGTIDKLTIVKTSGTLPFDVAAMDVIYSGAPYAPPPTKIRSPDGKAYMHWHFHRDWRQCGTFGVEPFILAEAPQNKRDKGLNDGDMVKNARRRRGKKPKPGEVGMATGQSAADNEAARAATARATANLPSPDDPRAGHAANLWLTGFTKRDIGKMVRISAVPFSSGASAIASAKSELSGIYKTILSESKGMPRKTKLYSPSQYRRQFGALPGGMESNGTELFYVVRMRKDQFSLVLTQQKNGEYAITGFYR